jgi:hypothetical protein
VSVDRSVRLGVVFDRASLGSRYAEVVGAVESASAAFIFALIGGR